MSGHCRNSAEEVEIHRGPTEWNHPFLFPSCLHFQSRGSDNPNTGPIRDHSSFTSNRVTGAFAYIDASPPRRPNDVAQIVSEEFTATGANRETRVPLFLRFALISFCYL